MLRTLLLAVVLAVAIGATPIGAADPAPRGWDKPTSAQDERPGYGVVESIVPLRRQARSETAGEPSASAGSSAPPASKLGGRRQAGTYLVKVRMDDGSIQVRSQKMRAVGVGERVLITNAGDVLPGDERRGSIPPGTAADGSRPADGAIKGGSAILPGERGGVPESRCSELSGTLREECQRQGQGASTGAPRATEPKTTRSPASPPPQNPR